MCEKCRGVEFNLADLHDTVEAVILTLSEFVIVVAVSKCVIGVESKVANHIVGSIVK